MPGPNAFIIVSLVLFAFGGCGVLIRRDAITIFLCIELMLNAANLAFITFARLHGNQLGQLFVLMVIGVAAAEAAVGLAIIILLRRSLGSILASGANQLKG